MHQQETGSKDDHERPLLREVQPGREALPRDKVLMRPQTHGHGTSHRAGRWHTQLSEVTADTDARKTSSSQENRKGIPDKLSASSAPASRCTNAHNLLQNAEKELLGGQMNQAMAVTEK